MAHDIFTFDSKRCQNNAATSQAGLYSLFYLITGTMRIVELVTSQHYLTSSRSQKNQNLMSRRCPIQVRCSYPATNDLRLTLLFQVCMDTARHSRIFLLRPYDEDCKVIKSKSKTDL